MKLSSPCQGYEFWWTTFDVVRPFAPVVLIAAGLVLELGVHYWLRVSAVYTPVYYLLVILAGLWYGRKAVFVALFFGGLQLAVGFILSGTVSAESLILLLLLVVIAFITGSVAGMIGCYRELLATSGSDLRDLKERLAASESSIEITNKKLNLLSSITRHDIRNQLAALIGYLDLLRMEVTASEAASHIAKGMDAARAIERQIEFTRIYEDIGTHAPLWQEVSAIVGRLQSRIPADSGITLDIRTAGLSIWADPLLGKVFENLVDNSLKHGERVRRIAISSLPYGLGGLAIVYEDDGVGIHEEDKEKIFERGFGKNTGLGLFLSREILAISGYSMKESGTYGKGVRFEILIPKGKYRLPPKGGEPDT
jgi:signal transduction histidine kinase